jgi:hypothetical protein
MEYLTKHLLPYVGRDAFLETMKVRGALPEERRRLGEVELVCMVTHLHNFESLVAQLSLRELADAMNKFYAAVADAILPAEGSVNDFVDASVVAHFNVLHKVEDTRIIEGAMNAFRGPRAALDEKLGARIGVGVCRGIAIVGGFGTESRLTFTAFGPSAICRITWRRKVHRSISATNSRRIFRGPRFHRSRGYRSSRIGNPSNDGRDLRICGKARKIFVMPLAQMPERD